MLRFKKKVMVMKSSSLYLLLPCSSWVLVPAGNRQHQWPLSKLHCTSADFLHPRLGTTRKHDFIPHPTFLFHTFPETVHLICSSSVNSSLARLAEKVFFEQLFKRAALIILSLKEEGTMLPQFEGWT